MAGEAVSDARKRSSGDDTTHAQHRLDVLDLQLGRQGIHAGDIEADTERQIVHLAGAHVHPVPMGREIAAVDEGAGARMRRAQLACKASSICSAVWRTGRANIRRRQRQALARGSQARGTQALPQFQCGRWAPRHGTDHFLPGATIGANGSGRGVWSLDTGRIGMVICG